VACEDTTPPESRGRYYYWERSVLSERRLSNRLCENTHSAAVLPVPSGSWSFFSITDGPSQRIHDNLITAVAGALADLWQLNSDESKAVPEPSIESIQHTLKKTFLELEADVKIVSPNSAIVAPFDSLPSSDARPGALLAFYDSHFRLLHIATTGSPCATLGRCMIGPDGFRTYTAHDLSHVQSEEAARLPASRSSKVVEGTSWALDPSVSSAFDTQVMRRKDIGPYPTDRLEIEVTSIKVQPGDFLILGSSGLWWLLDARTSVDLIGRWRGTESSFNMAMSLPDERTSHVQGTRPLTQDLVIGNKHPGLHLVRNALVTTDSDEMYDR
jgi:pyruvate dehydrogenase phosphatase